MGDQQKIQSSILKLETLKTQFNLALNQYKTASSNYETSKTQTNLNQVKLLNDRLTSINSQILGVLNEVNPHYQSFIEKTKVQDYNLSRVNNNLTQENRTMKNLLNEYDTLEHLQTETSLKVQSNYTYYMILIIIAAIIIFLFIKQLASYSVSNSQMRGGGNYVLKMWRSLFA